MFYRIMDYNNSCFLICVLYMYNSFLQEYLYFNNNKKISTYTHVQPKKMDENIKWVSQFAPISVLYYDNVILVVLSN